MAALSPQSGKKKAFVFQLECFSSARRDEKFSASRLHLCVLHNLLSISISTLPTIRLAIAIPLYKPESKPELVLGAVKPSSNFTSRRA